MGGNTMTMLFLGFGVLITVLGFYYASRRHMSIKMVKNESRGTHTQLELRGGPAVLAGVSLGLAGLWLIARTLPALTQGSEGQVGSLFGPIVLFAIGLLAGSTWQIARNVKTFLGSEEVKQKVIENIEGAIEAKQRDELSKPQKGIEPD